MKALLHSSLAIFWLFICFLPARAGAEPRAITMDMTTNLQPLGGAFRFSVTPALGDKAGLPVVYLCPTVFDLAFFDDKGALAPSDDIIKKAFDEAVKRGEQTPSQQNEYTNDKRARANACLRLTVQRLPSGTGTPSMSNFSAALSDQLPSNFVDLAHTYVAGLDNPATDPVFRMLVTGSWMHVWVDVQTTQRFKVGVTWRPLAALGAVATVLALGWGLAGFAKTQRVPGHGDPRKLNLASLPMRLISSNGRASLSQFQIMLWTFVVLGGAVYVVLLNGALIPLTSGTLVLLGISGAATLIAQAKDATAPAAPQAMPKPGKVEGVNVDDFADSSDLVVKWSPPGDLTPVSHYFVRYGQVAAPNTSQSYEPIIAVQDTGVRLIGLAAHVDYKIGVCANNPAGPGEWADALASNGAASIRTGPAPQPDPANPSPEPVAAPAKVEVLLQTVTESALDLEWTAKDKDTLYEIEFRRANSMEGWAAASVVKKPNVNNSMTVANLDSGVIYNFRVREQGQHAVSSKPIRAATQSRPRWSDLVTEPDRPNELEVTRVQMLLFTIVTAGFVTIKIIDLSVIPEIPPEYLVLMGISNSVYLSGKWARR